MYDINYLCGDTYFRSFMDVEGYMPLIYLFNYPNIFGVGADYYGVLEALNNHATLEVNAENETIRLRRGWDMVYMLPFCMSQLHPNTHSNFVLCAVADSQRRGWQGRSEVHQGARRGRPGIVCRGRDGQRGHGQHATPDRQ